jgi:hypothetical protein
MNEQHDKMVEAAKTYFAENQAEGGNGWATMADFTAKQVEPFATALRALVEALENPDEFDEILELRKAQAKALLADTPLTGE